MSKVGMVGAKGGEAGSIDLLGVEWSGLGDNCFDLAGSARTAYTIG